MIADTSPTLYLQKLNLRGVRNLEPIELLPSPRFNVISGANGHGKTSLLEAIYLAATSRSFRVSRLREVRAHDSNELLLRATFVERRGTFAPLTREQTFSLVGGVTSVTLNANRPPSLSAYATSSPIVVFHPDEMLLSTGPAALRRRLLDRIMLYGRLAEPNAQRDYAHALKARQELLRQKTEADAELHAYEEICARAGAALTVGRAAAVERLEGPLLRAFREIADPTLELSVQLDRGGSPDIDEMRSELERRRGRDARTQNASFGPHRDELSLLFDGRPARQVGSQGQHRALTLALKAAESAAIREATGLDPIQLLDDVSSELDPERTEALFQFLRASEAQIFFTTTRPELLVRHLPEGAEQAAIRIEKGLISRP